MKTNNSEHRSQFVRLCEMEREFVSVCVFSSTAGRTLYILLRFQKQLIMQIKKGPLGKR
jgi:predicted RNA-binding protein YlxR (DUF448 family)